MKLKFIYTDLVLFYKIVNELVPIYLPTYITICTPDQVRNTRVNAAIHDLSDSSSYRCSVTPNCDAFKTSYFYRSMTKWNSLPPSIRQAERISIFKSSLVDFLWSADNDWPD